MALPAHHSDAMSDDGSDDLSDEQIQMLLKEAEVRLRESAAQKTTASISLPRLDASNVPRPYIKHNGKVAQLQPERLPNSKMEEFVKHPRKLEDPVVVKQKRAEMKKATAGPEWFNLPKTDLTPELKRDLQLIKMRNVLDPHRHYKKDNGKFRAPEFSQVGTIIEGPTDFYSSRLNKRDRRETFADEILAGERETGRFKKKYGEIQVAKTSGKKAHYKALMAKRAKKFKR
ncbi:rRNA-processing protein FCF2 [Rhizodiscina lignyota]|uniref:rRNA-processing protein FCF2 n=1 Tax=Rhizodiscina lignyota TaxID=1504668 RepID=A0A9P4I5E0_9PEZI|nr:rRNA-processing protein FCF2 [Rhizodiscina lignyota]